MKRLVYVLFLVIILLNMSGCDNFSNDNKIGDDILNTENEKFLLGYTFSDGRYITFTFDVPYFDGYLNDAFLTEDLTLDEFIDKLEYISELNDGGSKLYRYTNGEQIFGNENFNVLVCNSADGVKDIFVAKEMDSLDGKCNINDDFLSDITMEIKDGTLTNSGATIIIRDGRPGENVYGSDYQIDKFINNSWKSLPKLVSNYGFTDIGYLVDKTNKLELDINWELLYGKLESGKYRIIKRVFLDNDDTKKYISTEFIIK